jgi:hypothetical protein
MKRINALDFLNKPNFTIDVYSEKGELLYPLGSEVTSEILLRAYFKKLYIKDEDENIYLEIDKDKDKDKEKETYIEPLETEVNASTERQEKVVEEVLTKSFTEKLSDDDEKTEETKAAQTLTIDPDAHLVFDETLSQDIANLSVKFAEHLGYSKNELEEIKQAAYYRNIGITSFKEKDKLSEDFKNDVGLESYKILKDKMNFPEKIAVVAKFYFKNYDVMNFKLNVNEPIPYQYLVGITNFYVERMKEMEDNDKVLILMLKEGNDKFNTFLLHKFINMMRNEEK